VACDVDTLSRAGACLPGAYNLSYTVTNANGTTATATRRVVVYQAGRVSADFVLVDTMETSAAAALVADLRNPASAGYAMAVTTIRTRLGAAGSGLVDTDIEITAASAAQTDPGSQVSRVTVSATAHVYYPPEVHRAALTSTAGARRRLRQRRLGEVGNAASEAPITVDDDAAARPRGVAFHVRSVLEALEDLHAPQRAACGGGLEAGAGVGAPCPAPRRRLQQASGGLSSSLSSFGAAFQSNLGASAPASSNDGADVDVAAGYLAAMASSVALLEERAALINASVGAVQAQAEQAFGADADRKDDTRDAQITTLYQASDGALCA
jgi:hypothetical protein